MLKIFGHYLPTSFVLLGCIEALGLVFSAYLGTSIRFMGDVSHVVSGGLLLEKAVIFSAVILLSITVMGLYQRQLREMVWATLLRVLAGFAIGWVILSIIYFIFPQIAFGRGEFLLSFSVALFLLLLIRILFVRLFDEDAGDCRVLVLGAGSKANAIGHFLRRKTDQRGFKIVGYVVYPGEDVVVKAKHIEYKETLFGIAKKYRVDEVVVAIDDRRKSFPMKELLECRMSGIEVIDLMTFLERRSGKIMLDILSPSWLVFSDGFGNSMQRVYAKRVFDILCSLVMLILSLPIMIITIIAMIIDDGFPVFYQQVRVGENNKLFKVLKFRSMRVDAEKSGKAQCASVGDQRITRVGNIIRKLRIDELPQIANVLMGDMSLVGPRPERPVFVDHLSENLPYYAERHRVKPGITGWAQISYPYGDSEKDSFEKLQFDLYYVKNFSIFLDLVILCQTIGAVLWGKGGR